MRRSRIAIASVPRMSADTAIAAAEAAAYRHEIALSQAERTAETRREAVRKAFIISGLTRAALGRLVGLSDAEMRGLVGDLAAERRRQKVPS